MSKTFYFYNCFISHNGEKTNIELNELIDRIMTRNSNERFKSIKQGNLCLIGMVDPTNNENDYRDRKVVIGKYRENKPYLGNIGTDRIDEIDDDVLELTSAMFIPGSRLVMVHYNHYGCRSRGLEQYLSSFLPATQDDSWSVIFEPIENDIGFNDVRNSRDIRRLEIRLDLSNQDRTIHAVGNHESLLGNIIGTTIESHIDFGANTATIGFGNGRGNRERIIDPARLVELVALLNLESDLYESVKVKYFSPTRGKVSEIDLKSQGILQRSLSELEDNAGWELICDSIDQDYYGNGRPGNAKHHNYEVRNSQLPDLVYNTGEEMG
jgi:hypothetical protein